MSLPVSQNPMKRPAQKQSYTKRSTTKICYKLMTIPACTQNRLPRKPSKRKPQRTPSAKKRYLPNILLLFRTATLLRNDCCLATHREQSTFIVNLGNMHLPSTTCTCNSQSSTICWFTSYHSPRTFSIGGATRNPLEPSNTNVITGTNTVSFRYTTTKTHLFR